MKIIYFCHENQRAIQRATKIKKNHFDESGEGTKRQENRIVAETVESYNRSGHCYKYRESSERNFLRYRRTFLTVLLISNNQILETIMAIRSPLLIHMNFYGHLISGCGRSRTFQ